MEAKPNFHFYAICRMRGIPSFAVVGCVGRAPLVHFEGCPIGHRELLPSVAVLLNSKSRKDAPKRTLQDSSRSWDGPNPSAGGKTMARSALSAMSSLLPLGNAMTHDAYASLKM
jgi:hypothetical protein